MTEAPATNPFLLDNEVDEELDEDIAAEEDLPTTGTDREHSWSDQIN